MVIEKHEISNFEFFRINNDENKISLFAYKKAIKVGKHPIGYDCINPIVLKENGKMYIVWERWDSCE